MVNQLKRTWSALNQSKSDFGTTISLTIGFQLKSSMHLHEKDKKKTKQNQTFPIKLRQDGNKKLE